MCVFEGGDGVPEGTGAGRDVSALVPGDTLTNSLRSFVDMMNNIVR